MNVTIASLHSYPVKSGRAIDHVQVTLGALGLPHDREWLVIDARGRFQTQRELPALARLEARVSTAALRLAFDTEIFVLPNSSETGAGSGSGASGDLAGSSREVQVWNSHCLGYDCGNAIASWLSRCLGRELRLVRFNSERPRSSDPAWTSGITALTAFPDGFPLLIANSASLTELNSHLQRPLPMNRFRPNIVLDGLDQWAEDRIDELSADGVRLRLVKPCTRCVIPTADQQTGERGSDEVIHALRELRYDPQLKGVTFAQNAIILSGVGLPLRVGQQFGIIWK